MLKGCNMELSKEEREKIEDEYDLAVANKAYNEYVASGYKSTAIEDFWKELDTTQN